MFAAGRHGSAWQIRASGSRGRPKVADGEFGINLLGDAVHAVFDGDVFVGYVTLKWHSDYQNFAMQNIPEISDLNVLPKFWRQGVGSRLLDLAEAEASKRSPCVGIGVGLYADYGNAQKLYVKRGYVPDGCGITYKNELVQPWETVRVDDDLTLWLVKKLGR